MALPIRLLAGARGDIEIPLEAQSIDIAIDRNASHFPLPNMPRIAIDTNTPEIGIEIQGILQDDDVNFESESNAILVQGNSIMLNFASILPTSIETINPLVDTGITDFVVPNIQLRSSVNSFMGITGTATTIDIHNVKKTGMVASVPGGVTYDTRNQAWVNIEASDNDSNADTGVDIDNSPGGYSAGVTSIEVDSSSHSIEVGQRLHKDDGTFIGTVTAVSGTTLTIAGSTKTSLSHNDDVFSYQATLFNHRQQIVGSVTDLVVSKTYDDDGNVTSETITHITVDSIEVAISDKEGYHIVTTSRPLNEAYLHNKSIYLYPNQWRNDSQKAHHAPRVVILLDATLNAHHDVTTDSSNGVDVSIAAGQRGQKRHGVSSTTNPSRDCIIKVPIKGITTKPSNGNPAATLALLIKRAVENTSLQAVHSTTFTRRDGTLYDQLTSTGGTTLGSAFSATVSGPVIEINQKQNPKSLSLSSNFPPTLKLTEQNSLNRNFGTTVGQQLVCEYFGVDGAESMAISNKSKSAGDKVQDLLGLFSNAQKQRDLIRGIQIPYDSLIQSSGVTGVARNFFLTFGEQSINDKGSLGNTISASEKMTPSLLPYEVGGDPVDEKDENWAERFGLGELSGVEASLGNFLENLVADSLITLSSSAHGNDGGMRILPEKLHVRYDAGNNYYAFNMKLLASDFVMGV